MHDEFVVQYAVDIRAQVVASLKSQVRAVRPFRLHDRRVFGTIRRRRFSNLWIRRRVHHFGIRQDSLVGVAAV